MTVVFTTIFGGSDSLKPAPAGADHCICFTDAPGPHDWDELGWTMFHQTVSDPRREAWRMRCRPHELFPKATRTVWVDASFTVTDLPRLLRDSKGPVSALRHHARASCYEEGQQLVRNRQATRAEIDAQLAAYRAERFTPAHLSISCVIVRDAGEQARRFNETWLAEIARWPGDNTQVSLDYSAWRHGFAIRALKGTRHANPYASHDHADHKRRRRPYR